MFLLDQILDDHLRICRRHAGHGAEAQGQGDLVAATFELAIHGTGPQGQASPLGARDVAIEHQKNEVGPVMVDEFLVRLDVLREEVGHALHDLVATPTPVLGVVLTQTIGGHHHAPKRLAVDICGADRLRQHGSREEYLVRQTRV